MKNKRIKPLHEYFVIVIVIVLILCEVFFLRPTIVDGISMRPTLENKDIVLMSVFDKDFKRGDLIIFNYSIYMDGKLDEGRAVKRVIGLEGDSIILDDSGVHVNGVTMFEDIIHDKTHFEGVVPKDSYFVLGDNRIVSVDSRYMGMIKKEEVIGKPKYILNKMQNIY